MNKKLIISAAIAAVMLSGCGAGNDVSQTAEISTIKETTSEKNIEYIDEDDVNFYDSYEDLMNDYNKGRSSNYVYPLPDIVDTWEFDSALLCMSNYTLYYYDVENGADIMLEIAYNSSYEKISDFFDGIGFSMGAETVEIHDRYSIQHYTEFDSYSLMGITGKENILYTLVVSSSDETKGPVELLKEYKDILEL